MTGEAKKNPSRGFLYSVLATEQFKTNLRKRAAFGAVVEDSMTAGKQQVNIPRKLYTLSISPLFCIARMFAYGDVIFAALFFQCPIVFFSLSAAVIALLHFLAYAR